MKNTDSQELPYPEVDDFGNGALQLQALAEAIDALLVAKTTELDLILTPEVAVAKSTTDITGISSGSDFQLFLGPDASYVPGPGAFGTTPFYFIGMRPGTHMGGFAIKSVPSGAVNANSYRDAWMHLTDYKVPGSSASAYTEDWHEQTWETATGFEVWQTLHAGFSIYSPDQANVEIHFQHGNTSSLVTVRALSYFWVARVGDLGI